MGYHAYGNGFIGIKNISKYDYAKKALEKYFHEVSMEVIGGREEIYVERYSDYNYHEEELVSALEEIEDLVEYGEICFTGDDDTHWVFIFKNGKFVEEDCFIYSESEIDEIKKKTIDEYERNKSVISYTRLKEILQRFVESEAEEWISGDLTHVSEKLREICKCSDEEIEELGFNWMFTDMNK